MTKYDKLKRLDEKAISVMTDFFLNKHGDQFDLQFHGIKDNTPDTDGFIRLRDGNGNYLNQVIFFQLKGKGDEVINKSYQCEKSLIDFCIGINLPTLLFIVGNLDQQAPESREIYWYHFSTINGEILTKYSKGKKTVKIPNLEPLKVGTKENIDSLRTLIETLAKKDTFQDLPVKVLELAQEYKDRMIKVSALIYLLNTVQVNEVSKISKILQIDNDETEKIIKDLKSKDLLSIQSKLIFFKKGKDEFEREIGLMLLYEAIAKINIDEVVDAFKEPEKKRNVFESLGKVQHPLVDIFFDKQTSGLDESIQKSKNNDDILVHLKLLETFAYRTPKASIRILKSIINTKNQHRVINKRIPGFGSFKGKSHQDLLLKAIDLLKDLRYKQPKETFALLIKLFKHHENEISEKSVESLKEISSYKYFALRRIRYKSQTNILDYIERLTNKQLIEIFPALIIVLEQILIPSFDGTEMTNYNKITYRRGALTASSELGNIRTSGLNILEKMFGLSKTMKQRKALLRVFMIGTQTPTESYSEELEKMILQNTNQVIEFYIKIVEQAELEIISEIAAQCEFYLKRYKDGLLRIGELQSLISQKEDYGMFRTFFGYDNTFDSSLTWEESEKKRMAQIQDYIDKISESNLEERKVKILTVINNYNQSEEYGKYQYFNIFLHKLGQQKPEIALKFVIENEDNIEDFLIHLLAGIRKSGNKQSCIDHIEKLITEEKKISICASLFSYVKEIDDGLLLKIFKKSKKTRDKNALNNIVLAIIKDSTPEKYISIFLESLKALTKLNDCSRIKFLYGENALIDQLDDTQYDIVLDNLLIARHVDHHVEIFLKKVVESNPQKMIKYFEKRIAIQKRKKNDGYDAIPYEFYNLQSSLKGIGAIIIPEVLEWFKKKDWLYKWEGGKFLKNIYSISELDSQLVKLIRNGKIEAVLGIFGTYQGHLPLSSKSIQLTISKHPKYHGELMTLMSVTGDWVGGDYGFVNSLENKRQDLKNYASDSRKYIQDFIIKYDEYLEKKIEYEKIRADEKLELLKNDFE